MRLRLLLILSVLLLGATVVAACGGAGDDAGPETAAEADAANDQGQSDAPAETQADASAPDDAGGQVAGEQPAEEADAGEQVAEAPDADPEPEAVTSYIVEAGDTLSELAAEFGTAVDRLVELNGFANANSLQVGQELLLPGAPEAEEDENAAVTEVEDEGDGTDEQEPAADEEPEEPASPPPAASTVTGTSPEGIPQPGPDIRVDAVPQRPANLEDYATAALPWLHGRTTVDSILPIFNDWGMPSVFGGDRLNLVDTDLDGLSSVVIVWTGTAEATGVGSVLAIYDPVPQDPETYRLAYHHSLALGRDVANVAVLPVVDMTGDGRRDLTFSYSDCGAHTCTASFHILMRDGTGYRDAVLAPIDIPTAHSIDVETDVTGDGVPDLQVTGGTFGSVGAEPQREFSYVFSAAGGRVEQVSREGLPTRWMVWALLEANEAFDRQDWGAAVALYNVVLSDASLDEFAPEAGEGDELRAMAHLRKSLALGVSGDTVGAQAAAQSLSSGQGLVADLGGAYLGGLASGDVATGCRAFNDALALRSNEWDAFWLHYGYGVPQLTADQLCPF